MNSENENYEDEISLKEIIAFLKKCMAKILLRGVISLAACRSEIFGFGKSMSIPIDA